MAEFRYSQTIFLRFTVTLFHSKQRANEQKVTSNEQKVTSNEQRAKSNEQRATSNEQKVQPPLSSTPFNGCFSNCDDFSWNFLSPFLRFAVSSFAVSSSSSGRIQQSSQ